MEVTIYNAVIVSQLTHGLSTVELAPAMLNKIDAFQTRGLKYILKIEHSYYSQVSNEEVYNDINIISNNGVDLNISWQEFISAGHCDKPKNIRKLNIWTCH